MSADSLDVLLGRQAKDLVLAMTFAVKDLRGSYARHPVEEIYAHNEIYFSAHRQNLLRGNMQPLIDFADMITRKRALDRFRLHELLRAAFGFKKAVYPLLLEHFWDHRDELVKSLLLVDRSVDRFVVNLAQAFVHYAKEDLARGPLEFPVWLNARPFQSERELVEDA
ncbi:MAG TPA: hypothetical protein P5079_00955 [Elusimicrobiota bacterium]|nr:hypothetical protein [Elusimicrobiota bacterium]